MVENMFVLRGMVQGGLPLELEKEGRLVSLFKIPYRGRRGISDVIEPCNDFDESQLRKLFNSDRVRWVSVVFDGTANVGEFTAIVLRFLVDGETHPRRVLARLPRHESSHDQEELAAVLLSTVFDLVPFHKLVFLTHDS
jgi:hypothetical protein